MRTISLFLCVLTLFLASSAGLLFAQMDHGHQVTDCTNGTCVTVSHSTAPNASCLDQCLALVERDVLIPTITTVFFALVIVVMVSVSRISEAIGIYWRRYLRDLLRITLLHQHLSTVVLLE